MQTHKGKIFFLFYVDNIIVKGGSPPHVSELVLQPGKKFAMKDLGPLHYSLRIEVKYFVGGIHLNRRKYVVELLSMIEMTLDKVVATSLGKNMVWMRLWEVLQMHSFTES